MNRRKYLAAAGGMIAIAGCSESSDEEESTEIPTEESTEEPIEEGSAEDILDDLEDQEEDLEDQIEDELDEEDTDPVEEYTSETETILSQNRRRLASGEYLYWGFELNRPAEIDMRTTVRDGSEVDIIITTPEEFRQFESGSRYRYYDDVSQEQTVGDDTSQTLGAGEYIVFIYNNNTTQVLVDIDVIGTG